MIPSKHHLGTQVTQIEIENEMESTKIKKERFLTPVKAKENKNGHKIHNAVHNKYKVANINTSDNKLFNGVGGGNKLVLYITNIWVKYSIWPKSLNQIISARSGPKPLCYEAGNNLYLQRVFSVLAVMLGDTIVFMGIIYLIQDAKRTFRCFWVFFLFIGIVGLVSTSCSLVRDAVAPCCNLGHLINAIVFMSMTMAAITAIFDTPTIFLALLSTTLTVFVLLCMSFSRYNFTAFHIYPIALIVTAAATALIIYLTRIIIESKIAQRTMIIIFVGTLVNILMFAVTAPQLAQISMGGSLGFPCVLLLQLQSNETTIRTDLNTLTWIASMHGVAGMGATLMPTIMQLIGRKYTFFGSCVLLLIGWILAFAAEDVFTVLLSAIFHGLSSNCITIINVVTVSKMLAPKYRSASMVLLSINQTIGQVLVTTLGTFLKWQIVAMIMCGPVMIALLMVIIWPESPSWLAYKGKFEASEKAFVRLKGEDDEANKDLKALTSAQMETRKIISNKKIQEIWQKMKRRDFYLPSLYMLLILLNFYICGALPLYIYSEDILEAVIEDPQIAVLGYLVTAGILLSGSLISIILIRFFNTKTMLLTSLGCILSLLGCSLVTYLQSIGFVAIDSILFLYFFLGFHVFSSSGFNPVTYALAIDLMPVKNRGIGCALFNTITCLFYSVTVKSLPYFMFSINISWTFFLLAISCLFCTILVWIYVPETKNRTLQEIEIITTMVVLLHIEIYTQILCQLLKGIWIRKEFRLERNVN